MIEKKTNIWKSLYYLLVVAALFLTTPLAQWKMVVPQLPYRDFTETQALDSMRGYTRSGLENPILTFDGWHSFKQLPVTAPQFQKCNLIAFASPDKIFATFEDTHRLWVSTDSCETWQEIALPDSIKILSMRFANSQYGILYGDPHSSYTSDGGATWNDIAVTSANMVVREISPTGVLFSSATRKPIKYSTDKGQSWVNTNFLDPNHSSRPLFVDNNIAYMLSYSGYFYRSSNGGITWDSLQNIPSYNFNFTQVVTGNDELFFSSGDKIYKLKNQGSTVEEILLIPGSGTARFAIAGSKLVVPVRGSEFSPVMIYDLITHTSSPADPFGDLAILASRLHPDGKINLIYAKRNALYLGTSEDSGLSWFHQPLNLEHDNPRIDVRSKDCFFKSRKDTLFHYLKDGQGNWKVTKQSFGWRIDALKLFGETNVILIITGLEGDVYKSKVIKSTDNGNTWIVVTTFDPKEHDQYEFSDENNWFFLSQRRPLITTNAGATWVELPIWTPPFPTSIYIRDSAFIAFGAEPSSIYFSTDMGINWIQHIFPAPNVVRAISMISKDTGYLALGEPAHHIYRTTDGGLHWGQQFTSQPGETRWIKSNGDGKVWAFQWSGVLKSENYGGVTGIFDEFTAELPKSFEVSENYPNPFNPSTRIDYHLSSPGEVTVKIYNFIGEMVKIINQGEQSSGRHTVVFDATGLSSGVYIANVECGGFSRNIKMILLK